MNDDELKSELDRRFNAVAELIQHVAGRLGQRVDEGFAAVQTRFDTQAARLDRHGALLQTGNRWVARLNDSSEKVDAALEQKDREITELRNRLDRLEKNGHG